MKPGNTATNNDGSPQDAYHFDNFSYSRSPRNRSTNVSVGNAMADLNTPFQSSVANNPQRHQGGYYSSSSSSDDAVDDAEKGFRPFPENGDYYPVNPSITPSSSIRRPPPAASPHDQDHLSQLQQQTGALDDHVRKNQNLYSGGAAGPGGQRRPLDAMPVLEEIPDPALYPDTASLSSSLTATDIDYVKDPAAVVEEGLPQQMVQVPAIMPGAYPESRGGFGFGAAGQEEGITYGEPVNFTIPQEYQNQEYQQPHLTEKKFLTSHGNLILDSETSDFLLLRYRLPDPGNEFRYMRYSSVTCEPSEFVDNKFNLRQNFFTVRRQTEILVCITLYDEEPYLVARTLKGVFQNIIHLAKLKSSSVWGEEAWKKVVVCLVADGRNKINKKTLALFSAIGVYQDGFARHKLGDKDIQAHLYEHTTMLGFQNTNEDDITFTKSPIPIQLLFCLKEKNKKKINSHRWCFEAFCPVLNPRTVVLLDAGTQPQRTAIYHLWNAFYMNPQVAGACGEIKAGLGPQFRNLLNPLVAAQNFEYKISNILDKPTESIFGFISVLPGAFSAYRYEALLNDENGIGPLEKYFKGEDLDKDVNAGVFQKNMYLAEDRILCFELVVKKKANWILKYVKSATAETDTPTAISSLVKQRRRWLNGSFFASFYALAHFVRIWQSGHSVARKFWLQVEFFYQAVQLVVSWFSIASFFLVFRILTVSLEDYFGGAKVLAGVFLWLYVATTIITFVISFGNRPEGTSKVYFAMLVFYSLLMSYTMFAAIFMAVKAVQDFIKIKSFNELVFHNSRFRDLVVSMASTYSLYFVASFAYFEPWHMFTSFLQYLLISPTYINVLNIYAFCNLHDLSWGSRDDEIKDEMKPAKVQNVDHELLKKQGLEDSDQAVGENEFLVSMDAPMEQSEVNEQYVKQIAYLYKPGEAAYRTNKCGIRVKINKRDVETREKDYYALIRSLVVIFWMATNGCLIAVVLSMDGFTDSSHIKKVSERRSEIFLTVILWIVAFLAVFRFVGCMLYLFQHIWERWVDWDIRKQIRRNSSYVV